MVIHEVPVFILLSEVEHYEARKGANMTRWYDRYMQGFYQEVSDELLVMQEHIFEASILEETLLVAREIMRRVRFNIELIIPRLHDMGYQFGQGFWSQFDDVSSEEKARIEQDIPVFKAPSAKTSGQVALLEQQTGVLPVCLKCWYEEVGSVNFIGLFPSTNYRESDPAYGCILDPLFIYSVDMAIRMITEYVRIGVWTRDPVLALAPDNYYKYGFSGSGTYAIRLPCQAFDAPVLRERHQTTFVNYLRLCFRWGGFPGLQIDNRLSPDELTFLTSDLLPF